jgi:hypothetical protein
MAVALAERRNTADGRFPARPKGATQMIQSGVAVLDKGDGHCLWTAPWLESSESLCIRHYQVDGVLVSRPVHISKKRNQLALRGGALCQF